MRAVGRAPRPGYPSRPGGPRGRGAGDPVRDRARGEPGFAGEVSAGRLVRTPAELAGHLFRAERFPEGGSWPPAPESCRIWTSRSGEVTW
ncbi:hypothetical protein NKH77_02475 [Streptomyces sp. M19]